MSCCHQEAAALGCGLTQVCRPTKSTVVMLECSKPSEGLHVSGS